MDIFFSVTDMKRNDDNADLSTLMIIAAEHRMLWQLLGNVGIMKLW